MATDGTMDADTDTPAVFCVMVVCRQNYAAHQTREAARAEAQEARGACEPRPRSPEHSLQCFYVDVSVTDTN